MIRVRLECRNVKIEEIVKCLAKLGKSFEYKIWKYNKVVYLLLRISSISDLEKLTKRLGKICELHFSRVDHTLPWWRRWMR